MEITFSNDIKKLSNNELAIKYLTNVYDYNIFEQLKKSYRLLIIILIANILNIDTKTFIKNNFEHLQKLIQEQSYIVSYLFNDFNIIFNNFIQNDIISHEDKISYIQRNFEVNSTNNQKTFLYHATHFINFIENLLLILDVSSNVPKNFITKYNLLNFHNIFIKFMDAKDFHIEFNTFYSRLDIPLLKRHFRENIQTQNLMVFLNSVPDDSKYDEEIIKLFTLFYSQFEGEIEDFNDLCMFLFNHYEYNRLLKIAPFVIETERIEDCQAIYTELEDNAYYGTHERGCCFDINGEKCTNYEMFEGACLCKQPQERQKYLKYKKKYLLLKKYIYAQK